VLPPPIFLHARDWARLHSAHHNGEGVPQKNYLQKFKFWPKIERLRPYNFATSGSSLTKLFQTTYCEGGVITGVPFLEGQPPKISEGQKTSKFRRDFWELWLWIANISRTDLHIEHLKKHIQLQSLPRWRKEIWWTLVHKQKKSTGAYWPTQVDILQETTFPPLGAAATSNFYTRYRLTKAC